MKPTLLLSASIGLLGLPLQAQNRVIIDPVEPLTDFTSLAEWNLDGDAEGWTTNQLPATIAGGVLSGTSNGGDTQLINNPFTTPFNKGSLGTVTIEFRLTRSIPDDARIDLFWNDASGSFAAARSLTLDGSEIPGDGLPHTYQFILENVNTELRGLRLDATTLANTTLEFDYVRLGLQDFSPVVDPAVNINLYSSLGEFNTPDDFEGWIPTNMDPSSVDKDQLTGLTSTGDSQLSNTTFILEPSIENADIIEVRLRREASDNSRIDLFWADDRAGFAGTRRISMPASTFPADGQFHVIHFFMASVLQGDLSAIRLDPSADLPNSVAVDIDYIRFGTIAQDDDNDGLANVVETGGGEFTSPYDTGTNPNDNDSDNDSYLDGDEVAAGTDPNDINEFPAPALTEYTNGLASYLVNSQITDNVPTVVFGTPLGFSVTPALPAGLTLDTNTGIISGTPAVAVAETTYTVTADFGGGITDDIDLTIAILNPGIISYGTNTAIYRINSEIALNGPDLLGEAPTSFSINPTLPTGLLFNTATGDITGTPTEITPSSDYTVTANYPSTPDSIIALSIRTRAIPVYLGRDNDPLSNFVSLGEWDTDGVPDGWTFARANGVVGGGILNFNATAADPIMNRAGLIDLSLGTTLEIRLRQNDIEGVQFFWADDTGGPAPERRTEIPGDQIANDGLFHTYQISFADVITGDLDFLRVDPGNVGGRTVEIDYIRIGSAAPATAPEVTAFTYDPTFGDIEITWKSLQGSSYRIESSPDLSEASWTTALENLSGDENTTTFLGSPFTTDRFFRVVREN